MSCKYCKIKLEFSESNNCGKNECFWEKCKELIYTDNAVIDFINLKMSTAELLLQLASLSKDDCVPQSPYKSLIVNYNTKTKAHTFLTKLLKYSTDKEMLETLGNVYYALRFYFLSARREFSIDFYTDSLECIKVKHNYADTSEFEMRLIQNKQEDYLFHGSTIDNWHSILHNGLYNYSGTKKMVNGQAYGPGIYLSDSVEISCGYTKSNSMFIIGVYQIIGDLTKYKKILYASAALSLAASLIGEVVIQTREYLWKSDVELARLKGGAQWVSQRALGLELKRRAKVWTDPRLFVWGYQSPLIFYSNIDGVTRDFFANELMKQHANDDHPLVRPRLDRIMRDLRAHPPDLIMTGDPPFPTLKQFLKERYLPSSLTRAALDGAGRIWVKRDEFSRFEYQEARRQRDALDRD